MNPLTKKQVRNSIVGFGLAGLLGLPLASSLAFAQEGHPAEGQAGEHEGFACTAASPDSECLEYWENHINWFSLDYKKSETQLPEHRHMPPPFGFALLNFAVFGWVIYRLAAQPIKDFVRTRHSEIRKGLDDAAVIHRAAETRLAAYETKIGGIDAEIDALLAQVRREAEAEKARIIAAAEDQARRLKIEAQEQIANQLERVRRELKAETVNAAIAVAEKLLVAQAATQEAHLTERFIGAMEGSSSAPLAPTPARTSSVATS